MSWLYSIFIAGLMFSTQNTPPVHINYNYTQSNNSQVFRLDETERFEQTYPFNTDGRINISNVNGSIVIETWERNEIKLEYVKTADAKEFLPRVKVQIDARQDTFKVETDYGEWSRTNNREWKNNGKLNVDFHLIVPRGAVLNEIETVNGSVSVSNVSNTTRASTVNGNVKVLNLRGTAKLSTVNGTIEADFDQLQSDGRISLDTVNGTVNLLIPSDANATIKADTLNGSIENDFGLPVRKGKYVGKDLYGKIGSGEVQIKLNSVNGGLSVKHKNDGRNLNPATNLLPAKNTDDEDWDAVGNGGNFPVVKPPKPPIVPRTPLPPDFNGSILNAEMQKQIDEALKEAQKEMGKLTPEMRKQIEDELKKANVDLNTKQLQQQIKLAKEKYKEALAQMSNANWLVGSPVIEKKSDSFAVKGTPKVTVEAKNCAVSVRGWDKPEVQYSATKVAGNRSQNSIDVQTNQSGADINVKVINNNENSGFFEANNIRLEIFVPKKSNLKITTDGEIRLEGVSGEIELNGEESAINVRDSEGKIRLTTGNGRIRVLGFSGDVDAQSAEGDINLEGNFQKLTVRTEDGSIILTLPEDTAANLTANREIINEGLNLIKQNENNWLIGKGGANFQLQTADGKIFLRNFDVLKSLQK